MDSSDVYIVEFSKLYFFLGLFFLSVYESCTSLVKFILSALFFNFYLFLVALGLSLLCAGFL